MTAASPTRIGPSRAAATAAGAVLLVLIVGGLTWVSTAVSAEPAFRVSAEGYRAASGSLVVNLTFRDGPSSVAVGAGIVPGFTVTPPDPTLYVFADPSFQPRYGAQNDVDGLAIRLHDYLALAGSDVRVEVADGSTLYGDLETHPGAMLAVIGTGIVPDDVFSNWSSLLPNWVREGGLLFWAGGPIGYESGHAIAGGFVHSDLYWQGQRTFFGFDLVDPSLRSAPAPVPGAVPAGFLGSPTGFSQALGVTYPGTPEGANTSVVQANGGVSLGMVSPGVRGASPRTSLAYLPEGAGGVFYFGGAMAEPGVGYVPGGSVDLAEDIATLIVSGYVPQSGTVASAVITLVPFGSDTVRFALSDAPSGYVAFVHAAIDGSNLVFWSRALPVGVGTIAGSALGLRSAGGPLAAAGEPTNPRSR